MALFKRNPPKLCPGCGRADGWRCMLSDTPNAMEANAAPVNAFTTNPVRGSIVANMMSRQGQSKRVRYHCDHCGFEKSY